MNKKQPTPRFRTFRPEDQNRVRQLIMEGLGDHFSVFDASLNTDLDHIQDSYLAQGHCFIVGEIDRTIVAAGALMRLNGRLGRLARVSVAREKRRRGYGRATVRFLLDMAHALGIHRVLVETNHDWYAAIALYHGCGFREYARDVESIHLELILPGALPGEVALP